MNPLKLTFTANEQALTKTDNFTDFASNTVSYIEATFTLGENWSGYDSVRAVWKTDYYTISTVLDANFTCIVPTEVLRYKAKVFVNLVGSIVENDTLTDRLTTFPVLALTVKANAAVNGSETAPVTPSQFEQFVETVQDAAGSISDYSYDSEAWAVGTRGGVDVPSTDQTYHNNSKYWAEENAGLADDVADLADDVADLKSEINDFEADSLVYSNIFKPSAFEQGNIGVSNYTPSVSESTLTCHISNPIICPKGTIIRLKKSSFKWNYIYGVPDGKWYSQGTWRTDDLTVSLDTKIYINVRDASWGSTTPSDCVNSLDFIFPNTYQDKNVMSFKKAFSVIDNLTVSGAFWASSNGIATGSSTGYITNYIPVVSGDEITYNLPTTNSNAKCLAFYDDDMQFVEYASSNVGTYTVPSAGFVRFARDSSLGGEAWFNSYHIPDQVENAIGYINQSLTDVIGTSYMEEAQTRIVGELKDKSVLGNIVTFGFSTDQHILDEDDAQRTLPVLRGLKVLSRLTQAYPYDFICLGGDACDAGAYATTPKLILDECVTIQKPLHDAWCPVVPITGNHDAAQNNRSITGGMLFNAHFKRVANSGLLEGWDNTHTNGYWDSEAHNIRFIFFDDTLRSDYDYTARSNALTTMLSGTPSGYNIVIFSHHVISSALTNSLWANPLGLQSLINPYASRIICCISGHVHADISETSDGILYIATTLAQFGGDAQGHQKTINTEDETAFDTFVIDQDNKAIYALRYGYGENRSWTYTLS